ncbi:hypothetical protein CB1_000365078 [Camelus ferus]|nr:hypothetical protein CB1_000365078 [Camelus ferus]
MTEIRSEPDIEPRPSSKLNSHGATHSYSPTLGLVLLPPPYLGDLERDTKCPSEAKEKPALSLGGEWVGDDGEKDDNGEGCLVTICNGRPVMPWS